MSTDRRTRVAYCLDSFDMGGTEFNAVRTAEEVDRSRYDISFIALSDRGALAERVRAAGIPIHVFPLGGFFSVQMLRSARRLVRHLREQRVDVVHAHDIYSNIFTVPCARLAGVPMVIASRRWWHAANRVIYLTLNRATYHLAHRVLANSEAVGQLVVDEGMPASRVTVVPNFVEESAFEAPTAGVIEGWRRAYGVAADDEVVGIIANLHAIKDHPTLLRAFARVVSERPRARLVIAGDGADRGALEQLAESLGIGNRVSFTGRVAQRPSMHWLFDVSVLSSRGEGFPNSIVEAMSAGRPVVSTAVGGVPDVVVDGETGILVPPASPESMADAILALLRDPARRATMGAAGARRARARFHASAVVQQLQSLYDDFLATRRQ